MASYQPSTMETPNIDQWFLRDCLWRYLRQSARVHDRCFHSARCGALAAGCAAGQ